MNAHDVFLQSLREYDRLTLSSAAAFIFPQSMNAFRVLSTDRVSSSGSFAGFVNRNPLKQGTILDNSHWMTISTSEDGTRIEDVKFNR